jgi:hypothetical protein
MASQSDRDLLAADAESLHKMGYAQELSRRMGGFSNFAVSFSIICILAGGITSFQVGFCTGGGFTTIIGWIIGSIFALIVGLSMAQISSAYPTAGGLYHWSSILGGRGWGWATAWFNMLGLIFVIASVNVGVYSLFTGLILGNIFNISTSSWGFEQQTVAVVLITLSQGLFNHFGIKTTTKMIDFSGYLILVVAILLTIAMLFGASHIDLSRLVAFHNNSGAPGGSVVPASTSPFYLFLLALLYPLYTITGFDGSAHTSEETIDARHNVPKGMLNAIIWSALFGLAMAATFILAMPNPNKAAADGGSVILNLLAALPVNKYLKELSLRARRRHLDLAHGLCLLARWRPAGPQVPAPRQRFASIARRSHLADGSALDCGDALLPRLRGARRRLRDVPLYLLYHADRRGAVRGGQDLDRVRPLPPWRLFQAARRGRPDRWPGDHLHRHAPAQ